MIVAVAVLIGLLVSVIVWPLWAALLAVIATDEFRGPEMTMAFWRLLRAQGFAMAPQMFSFLVLVPSIGPVLSLAVSLWSIVAVVIATRMALDVTTGRALGIVFRAWIVVAVGLVAILHTSIAGRLVG